VFKDVVGVQLHSLGSDPLSPKRLSYPKSELHVCSEFVFATVTTDRTHEFSFEFYREVLRWIEFLVVLYPVPRIMNRVRLRVAVLEIHSNLRIIGQWVEWMKMILAPSH